MKVIIVFILIVNVIILSILYHNCFIANIRLIITSNAVNIHTYVIVKLQQSFTPLYHLCHSLLQ